MITASSFTFANDGSSQDTKKIAAFTQALLYLQTSSDGRKLVETIAAKHIMISFREGRSSPDEYQSRDFDNVWPAGVTGLIHWDPTLTNTDYLDTGYGFSFGEESPALGLAHELTHALYSAEQLLADTNNWLGPLWKNVAEQNAVLNEALIGSELNEPVRLNYLGGLGASRIHVANPTDHVFYSKDVKGAIVEEQRYESTYSVSNGLLTGTQSWDSHLLTEAVVFTKTTIVGATSTTAVVVSLQPIPSTKPLDYGSDTFSVNGFAFSANGSNRQSSSVWTTDSGVRFQLASALPDVAGSGTISISGAPGASSLLVNNFDVFKAETAQSGFFGIHLKGSIDITQSGSNFTLSIDGPSRYDQTFTVKLSKPLPSDFVVMVGSQKATVGKNGTFTVTLAANTSAATFSLFDGTKADGKSDISKSFSVAISAALQDSVHAGGQIIVGAPKTFVLAPKPNTVGAPLKNLHQINSSTSTTGTYSGDGGDDQVIASFVSNTIDLHNSVNDNIVGGTGANIVTGGSGNNVIALNGTTDFVTLGTGHTSLDGASGGHDTVKSTGGSAIINAHGGTDIILLGNGNNEIYADSQIALDYAIAQQSSQVTPASLKSGNGPNAMVAAATQVSGATHQKGDLISVLDGNDTVVSGLGDDLVNAGSGHSVVVLGPGQDTFLGGWEVTDGLDSWHTQMDADGVLEVFDVNASVEPFSTTFAQPYNGNMFIQGNSTLKSSASNATVFGGSGNDLINLGNGSNYVEAGSGNTSIYGGMGNDVLVAGSGTDFIRGGGGNTNIQGGSGTASLYGGDGNNTIIGGSGNATIASASADSRIKVNGRWDGDTLSNNYVFTGTGNDLVFGSAGHDTLIAGSGNVTIQGGLGYEYMLGGSGTDFLIAGEGNDTLVAGSGDATLQGGGSSTTKSWMYGGDGTDLIVGGKGENVLYAGDGGTSDKKTSVSSSLSDSGSKTTIYGGMGVDWLQSGSGTTVINVGDGGTAGAPTSVVAGTGATTVNGGAGLAVIWGGAGTSVLNAGTGGTSYAPTSVIGGAGTSTLAGGGGAALLVDSGSGKDVLIAGSGNDTLVGMGADTYIGGQGYAIVQNNAGHATVNLGSETGATTIYNFGGGTTNLVLGGGVTTANLNASVAFDGTNRSFLTFDMPTGAVSIQGALTGSLTGTTFDSGSVTTPALMTAAFQSDQSFQDGSYALHLAVGAGESLSGGNSGDTLSAWGANETITGAAYEAIYSAGARAYITAGVYGSQIVAAGDQDTVVAGQYGSDVTVSGASSLAINQLGNGSLTASGPGDTLVGGAGTTQFYVNDSTTTIVDSNLTGQDAVWSSVNFTLPTNAALTKLTLTGTADIVGTGNNGTDVITGGAGHDTLVAGSGIATLIGGTNSTTFVVNNIYDTVVENNAANADTLVSSVNVMLPNNVNFVSLTGGATLVATANSGPDTLVSNTGIDTLYGGGGGDLFIINNSADVIVEATGATNDTLQTAYGMTLPSNVNTLVLMGSAALLATANGGDDTLVSNSGIDTLVGGAGNDTFVVNNALDVVKGTSATSHNTIVASVNVTLPTNVNTLTLTGTADLQATGNAAADLITANSGNDTLKAVSTTAATTLMGGTGNDVFAVNNTADVVQVASTTSNDTIQSSADFTAVANVNTLVLTGTANLKATANDAGDTLVSNTGADTLTGGAGNDVFVVNNAADVLVNVGVGDTVVSYIGGAMPASVNNLVLGGSANLQATTNGGNAQLTGNAGADTLVASTGQDTLVAGTGPDTLVAGSGNDLFVVNNTSDVVSLSGAHGIDTLQSSVNWTLQSGINMLVLTGTGNLTGRAVSGNNRINANAGSDTLYAGSGNDTLSAQDGPATLVGGAGIDTFIIANTADVIQNISAAGNTVYSSVNYTMQAGVAVLNLFGSADLSVTGNATADTIVGNFGNDTLTAGTGAALLEGGMGADLFVVNSASDVVAQSNYGQKGTADTIQSSVAYTLPGTVDNLVLTGTADLKAIGNQNADVIVGNSGKDTLVAGQGDDTLISGGGVTLLQGGPGNDTYVVNNALDTVTTSAADSYNVLQSSVTYTMPSNISEMLLIGAGSIQGTSNGLDVLMTAGDGADTLVATTGQDTLVAGNGLVTMTGGTGNDTFVVNNRADVVSDATTNKSNVVLASDSFVLPANVETLTLTGSGDISATGNGDGRIDTLNAGYGNDTLYAGADQAVLNGGPGATTFVVNNINDVVQNADPTQANALQSSVTYTLPTNVNLLTLTGSAAITGTGNAGADTLIANSGLDTLVSGSCNDLFILGNVGDKVTNAFTTNADTIQSAFNVTLPTNVNVLVLTGTDALTGHANGGNDTLISNAGADTFTGGAGNDTFIINNAADVVNGASASTHNTIIAGVNVTLPTNVNTLLLTGTADLQAGGNAGADLIVANDGNDTLTAASTAAATTLVGGIGNDVFVVNNTADAVQVVSTTALDTIQSSANFTAVANVNTLVLTGTANLQATANDAGDTLVSNTGVDTLVGGAGNDVFVVNNTAEVLVNLSAGDTIMSSVAWPTLATPGVTLVLTGASNRAVTLAGNADTAVAGGGNDTLTASGTNETLFSGAGSDLFIINDASDAVAETQTIEGGQHSIQSSVSYTLPDYIDVLTLTGTGDLTATGNADYENVLTANSGNDHLVGTAYVNTLNGGSGRDTIDAGPGSNVIHAGSGGAQYYETTVNGGNTLGGTDVSDIIYGDTGVNMLLGGAGYNTIIGGTNTVQITANGENNFVTAGSSGTVNAPLYISAQSELSTSVTTIMGGGGIEILTGGAGTDMITAGSAATTIDAGSGATTIQGGIGANVITGGAGADVITAGDGATTINAGSGAATIQGGAGTDAIAGGSGVDLITAGGGATTITAGTGSTTIQGGAGANVIKGGAGANVITAGGGATTINAGTGSATIQGGSGMDVITGGAGTNLITAGSGATTINAGTGLASIWGSNGSMITDASGGHDLLVAGGGAETLSGSGSDTMVAGSGTDVFLTAYSAQPKTTYQFNTGFGQVSIQGGVETGDVLQFGHGFSPSGFTVSVQPVSGGYYSGASGTSLVLHYGSESIAIQGGIVNGVISSIVFADSGPATLAQLVNAGGPQTTTFAMNGDTGLLSAGDGQTVTTGGSFYQAFIFGNGDLVSGLHALSVEAYGNADTLVGGSGIDGYGNSQDYVLSDNQGANVYGSNATLTGGSSNSIFVQSTPAKMAFTGTGNVLTSAASVDLPTGFTNLTLVSGYSGLIAHSNAQGGNLTANGDYDTLVGGSGTDTLSASGKYDVLVGGSGATTFYMGDATDSIQLGSASAANNTIISTSSYTLPSGINNLILQGASDVGTANAGNDILTSTSYAQTLVGGAGNDTLVAESGAGGNVFVAGSGKTTFVNISSSATVIENYANTGSVIQGYGTITLPTNVDNFVDIGGGSVVTGNAGNDSIVASNSNADTLIAGTGFDTLVGGSLAGGNGDTFVINQGFTHDIITNVQANAHNVLQFGTGVTRASLTFAVLQGAAGTAPSLVVTSGAKSVTLQGGLAPGGISAVNFADGTSYTLGQLLAPSGTATIAGGGGNLIIVGADNTVMSGGTGHDTIMAWGNGDTLKAGTGGAVVFAGGNADVVVGSASSDTLGAYGASDSLVSGSGNEIFVVNSTDAVVNVSAAQLHDTVQSSVNYTVPANASVLQLLGSADLQATGGTTAATIIANSGHDTLTAGAQADTMVGSATGGDLFVVNSAADVLVGGAGAATDTVSSSVNYTLPSGVDTLQVVGAVKGKANDDAQAQVFSFSNNATLVGGAGADVLDGEGNGDVVVSGTGVDYLVGGQAPMTFVINNPADVIASINSNDTVQSAVDYTLNAPAPGVAGITFQLIGSGNLTAKVAGSFTNYHFIGNAGQDTLIGNTISGAFNTLESGTSADDMIGGGAGTTNTFIVHNSGDTVIASAAAASNKISTTASITLPANVYLIDTTAMTPNLVLTANSGNDTMYGNIGTTLIGGSGNDYMGTYNVGSCMYVAGTGNDTIVARHGDSISLSTGFGHVDVQPSAGGSGAILVQFGDAATSFTATVVKDRNGNAGLQLVNGNSALTLEGAFGTNNYQFKFGSGSAVPLERLLAMVQEQNSTFVGAAGNLVLNGTASASLHGGTGADTILAAGASDTLTGGSGAQWLEAVGANVSVIGGSGADTLEGFGTNDTLTAGTAVETLVGGTGASVLFVINNASDVIQLQSSPGVDTIATALNNYSLPTGVNALVLQGSAALKATANSGTDTLTSNTGVDTLVAGTGSDMFVLNNAADVVSIGSSHGVDTIQASFNDTLATNAAVLVLGGSTALMGTGNTTTDTLKANDAGDTLVAGTGAATMIGGAGNDLFLVNNTADSVQSAAGNDTISSSVTFTLPTGVNTLVMTGSGSVKGAGNAGDDLLTATGTTGPVSLVAGAGVDTLVSGTGTDSLVGGTGNDLFIVNSAATVVTDASSAGSDTLQSTFTTALGTNVNTLVLSGSGAITGTANSGADFITAAATSGAVTLNGGNGADTMIAGSGADVLKAGSGIASMVGGSGNDLFYVTNTSDAVVNASTTNADTVSSSATYTLPANVNTLLLTGSNIVGTGNAVANILTAAGDSGAVTLTAGAGTGATTLVAGSGASSLVSNSGVDSLVGGTTGNDLFILNNSADVVTVGTTHGVDTIQASFNDTLAANVQVLVLSGTTALKGTGNTLADTLKANDYGDTLVAGTGAATLIGGAANDLFMINNTADSVQSAAGNDTISSSVGYTLPTNVNTLVLTASGIKGIGNASGADLLTAIGTTGAVTLVAGNGADTLVSGTGAGSLVGGSGNDVFIVNSSTTVVYDSIASGADTIQSSFNTTLPTNVQTLVLNGSSAVTGNGNGATSLIIGGTGAQTLAGGTGVALLEAGTAGAQVLKAASNQAALIGGGAANTLTGGAYKDFFAAGKIGDAVTTGATANVIAYNKGDGALVIAATTGASNVLSLGAGIDTEGLTFTKSGNNLVLNDGVAGDSITFTNWFAATANQTTKTLQVIESASASYNSAGTDVLRNKPIEEFNFTTLVANFTTAGNPANWQLSQKEGADTIASSATSAYGGDLAYYYGKNGNLTGLNVSAAQSTLTNASYATALQTVDAWASVSGGASTMAVVAGGSSTASSQATSVTAEPIVRSGTKQATYVNATQLATAMRGEGSTVSTAAAIADRTIFDALWSAMHRQLDVSAASGSAGVGAEVHGLGLAPDVVAMLSGAGADHMVKPDRKVSLPAAHMNHA